MTAVWFAEATAAAWTTLASTAGQAVISGVIVFGCLAYGAWLLFRPAGPEDPS